MNTNDLSLLIAKCLKRFPALNPVSRKYNERRHQIIAKSIEMLCDAAADEINISKVVRQVINDGPIWILWWQGMEYAPEIVKKCVRSIQRNSYGREVIIITQDNIREYACIPHYIYEKMKIGSISFTHFSDILRFNLLHLYGGLWMDATLYVVRPLDDERYRLPFFTCSGYSDPALFNVSNGRWTGFFIGGVPHEPLFAFMNAFFAIYWKQNDILQDYFLIDYALDYAYSHKIGSLREWCESEASKCNPAMFDLMPLLQTSFNIQQWDKLKQDTDVFKVSWKKTFAFENLS